MIMIYGIQSNFIYRRFLQGLCLLLPRKECLPQVCYPIPSAEKCFFIPADTFYAEKVGEIPQSIFRNKIFVANL